MTIAIIDYGMGNLRSLMNAFSYLGLNAIIASSDAEIEAAERLVLPGVGAFGDAMTAIRERGLEDVLTSEAIEKRKPILGVCLGMQLFAKSSVEHGHHRGLGWIDADIQRLQVRPPLKVPHVGWNSVSFSEGDHLFRGIRLAESNFYFVHSFHMVCHDAKDILATTDYGGPITAVVRSHNLVAAQFHPEKSQDNGLQMLRNWARWTP